MADPIVVPEHHHRVASHGPLGEVGNSVHYLVSDPVEETFDDFVALGRALRENGRFPVTRPSLQVAGLRLLQWQSSPHALVSPEVVPFRPHRGVLLIVEEATDARPNEWLQWLRAELAVQTNRTPGVVMPPLRCVEGFALRACPNYMRPSIYLLR